MAPKRIIQKRRKQLAMAIRKSSSVSPMATSTPSSSSQSSTPRAILSREELIEMRRLGKMLPLQMQLKNRRDDPLVLINDVTKYISHLTATVVARVQKGSLPREVLNDLLPQASSFLNEDSSPSLESKINKRRLCRHL